MKLLTINDLMKECIKQINKGNGNKVIMISNDDEGNGYHYLWYTFETTEDFDKQIEEVNLPQEYMFNYNEDRISKKEDTIILG